MISFSDYKTETFSKCHIVEQEQDDGGVGGRGVHLSPWMHQDYTFRHRSACRIPAGSRREDLTSGKQYIAPHKTLLNHII